MNALIIGRFQPLHLGHVDLIKKTRDLGYNVIIGVGNNGDHRTEKYPFVFEEVKQMFSTLDLPLPVYRIPDINNDSDYAEHVETITGCSSQDTVIVSGNNHTIECFTQYLRIYKIVKPGVDFSVEYKNVSATRIRELMAEGGKWGDFVSSGIYQILQRIKAEEKVKHTVYHNI